MNTNPGVDEYLVLLDHPERDRISAMRTAILGLDERVTESIKWNAPNFLFAGEDRATFRLKPGDRFQLVLHRGSQASGDQEHRVEDPDGLVEWLAPDRGVVDILALSDESSGSLLDLILRWMKLP